jgi:hypothetical protein
VDHKYGVRSSGMPVRETSMLQHLLLPRTPTNYTRN